MSTSLHAPPPLAWFGMEPMRALYEYACMRHADLSRLPRGDGHPVVVFPGLASSERSLGPLIDCCSALGYATCDWGRGYNLGPRGDVDAWIDGLAGDVERVAGRHGRAASLIGWSLGGIYAREVAKRVPGQVRRVITIATPFAGSGTDTHVGWLYRLVNGRWPALDAALAGRLRTPPPVPCTSIYSRSDGIVPWQDCIDAEIDADAAADPRAATRENVEVDGSHSGMGWNPRVLAIVADRLARVGPLR